MEDYDLTEDELFDCRETFEFLDRNNNNKIELSELCSGLGFLGLHLTNKEIQTILENFAKESKESLNFEEYKMFYKQCIVAHDMTRDEAERFFRDSDLTKDGYLDVSELRCMLIDKGEILDDGEISSLLRDYDTNRDSRLSLEEFLDSVYS
ncbi:hypothetical protein SteCoe_19264 [Stentor coeruleus]|uniref:Calmodulin n=1 Tax=Stentor coeruleus TaxID=5963 RepID=A0A1R2BUG2_9CILI|nr:hypothetical protein SteCoe_19264 [Stentor coeruleus]